MRISQIVDTLSGDSGLNSADYFTFFGELLQWISATNQRLRESGERYTLLPFKLHQFISQTGSVCGTLFISLDVGFYIFSINCRFADVKKAVAHFKSNPHLLSPDRLNPFSGKWNFNGTDATDLVTEFFIEINPLLNGLGTN